ncbi:CvpA family protein [Aquimonas sp.]|jgi:membrane protein required for colicin V production|uniref:CvpA family protein n=1 Tax=Aquimonas sp. TaxID=1872588 RepID=UPI0037C07298
MLSWADIVLLAIVGLSVLVGFWRGFVVEVMSLAVWVASFWLAFTYGDAAALLFEGVVEAPSARLLLGYALLFALALAVGGLATWLMGKLVKSTGLSGTDRLFGLVFGAVRGYALAAVVVLLAGFTALPADPWWEQSRVLPAFQRGAEWLRTRLPEAVADEVNFVPVIELKLPADSAQRAPDAR